MRPSLVAILSGSGENVFYVAGLDHNDVGDRFRWRRWWAVVRRARLWLARGVDRPAGRSCERGKLKSHRKDRRKEGMLPFMHPNFVPSKKLIGRARFWSTRRIHETAGGQAGGDPCSIKADREYMV